LFVTLLWRMMKARKKPVHLVVDGLPAHKTKRVRDHVASTKGRLTLHSLPGYAPDLKPDELVWGDMTRTGLARTPPRRSEKLQEQVEAQLAAIKTTPELIRSFFKTQSVAYITH
jgi:transposase